MNVLASASTVKLMPDVLFTVIAQAKGALHI